MRIAYVHYLREGSTALNHARQFAEAARCLGHQVIVHALNSATRTSGSSTHRFSRFNQTVRPYLARYLHEPKELVWNLPRFAVLENRMLRDGRPDVLLVRDNAFSPSCIPLARRLALPLVLEVNGPYEEMRLYEDEYFHVPWIADRLQAWKLRRAHAVTVVSSKLKEYLARECYLAEERFVVVPNGADVSRFRPNEAPDPEVLSALGGNRVIGFVGSFHKFHGPELLATLIREVCSARSDVKFLLVGDGPKAAAVRAETRRVGDRVLFTGRVPHQRVPGLVAAIDVGVMPESNFYGSPLKVVEWMAAGCAVVAPAYGPLQEIIKDERDGLLFPPRRVEALVRAVLRLVDDSDLRRTLGEAAAKRVRASLTWSHNARRVVGACDLAISRHRARLRRRSGTISSPLPDAQSRERSRR